MLKYIIALCALTALNMGCTRSHGVSQGNGMGTRAGVPTPVQQTASYTSKALNYQIAYDATLTLTEVSPTEVTIDNSKVIGPKDQLSTLNLKGLALSDTNGQSITDLSGLQAYLHSTFPNKNFQPVSYSGIQGYADITSTANSLSGSYYLLINTILVQGDLAAYSTGNGIATVGEIIKTMAPVDRTPPVFQSFSVSKTAVTAGESLTVYFKATDDVSGVSTKMVNMTITKRNVSGTHWLPLEFTFTDITYMGDDTYAAKFSLSPYLAPGDYIIHLLAIWDNAGNSNTLTLREDTSTAYMEFYPNMSDLQIPAIHLQVSNPNILDTTPPELELVSLDAKGPVQAGSSLHVIIKATDSQSGVDPTSCEANVADTVSHSDHKYDIGLVKNFVPLGNDYYEGTAAVGAYVPSLEYYLLQIYCADRSGNYFFATPSSKGQNYNVNGGDSSVPILRFPIVNSGVVDVTPPIISKPSLQSQSAAPGTNVTLTFTATDDLSGVDPGHVWGAFWDPVSKATFFFNGPADSLGKGIYKIDVTVGAYVPAGNYLLEGISVFDLGKNEGDWKSDKSVVLQVIR